MKGTKKTITDREYQKILKRLETIEYEGLLFGSIKYQDNCNNHVKIFNSFDEIIIALMRNRYFIEREIELEKKRYLSTLTLSNDLKLKLEYRIKQLVFEYLMANNTLDGDNLDTTFIPILMNYPDFKNFLDKILDLTSKQVSNLYLLEYVSTLQIEREELLQKKYKYEKYQKKLLKKR